MFLGPENKRALLELRGNPYPPVIPDTSSNKNLIHNILLEEAKKAYRTKKYAEIAAKIDAVEAEIGLEKPAQPSNIENQPPQEKREAQSEAKEESSSENKKE